MANEYSDNWRRYRRVRNLYFLLLIGYVPVCLGFEALVSAALKTSTPGFVFAGLWMVTILIVGVRLSSWRCPRCEKCFAGTWWCNKGFLARKCVHCGLPKFAPGPGS